MRERSVAETVARYYAGQARSRLVSRRPKRKSVRLTALTRSGRTVTLRSPRFSDAAEWRRIRLRDQAAIEPFWVSSELDWAERHTDAVWIRQCLRSRADTLAGHALPMVIEVDGRFAGQCNLEVIDDQSRSAEAGIWVDSTLGGSGVGATASVLIIDYAFHGLGMQRVTAPISTRNLPARTLVAHIGLICEGTMSEFMDVGGHRSDHELWATTADRFERARSSESHG